jgi:hypothetical protein
MPELKSVTIPELIRACGGPVRLGRELGIRPSAISNWLYFDRVPERWHAVMLATALRLGIAWRPPNWPPQAQLRWNRAA